MSIQSWFLCRKLHKLGTHANPSPYFEKALSKRLQQEAGISAVVWLPWSKVAASVASFGLIMGSATGVYAYSSDAVLPDSPLYGVRQQVERIELAVAWSHERQDAVRLKLSERRKREQELMRTKMVQKEKARIETLKPAPAQPQKAASTKPKK